MLIEQSNPHVEIVCSEGITLVPLMKAALEKKVTLLLNVT